MPYFAVMAAAMGLQQLKAWQDNKQKEAFAAKQKEIRVAMQNREFDRLRRLQAEAHQIALDMEREAHEQRRQDIEKEYDNVFDALLDQFQLDKWPLNIVPFIMKGESFGSHVRGHDVATVHCLLTPSNNLEFNRYVYSKLDQQIETSMNLYWNSNTDHNVVYYGSSWKQKKPSGIPYCEYKDVQRLYADLRNVPFICITPYFKETTGEFYFKVWVWGMGATSTNHRDIYPPMSLLKEELNSSSDFSTISNSTLTEISSYLISMVGYLTDMYYWKMYQLTPVFPLLSSSNSSSPKLIGAIQEEYLDVTLQHIEDDTYSYISRLKYLESHKSIIPLIDFNKGLKVLLDKYIACHPVEVEQELEFLNYYRSSSSVESELKIKVEEHLNLVHIYQCSFVDKYVLLKDYDFSANTYNEDFENDLCAYLDKFVEFITSQSDRINEIPNLYVKLDKETVYLNLYSKENGIILTNPKFAYKINLSTLKNIRNVRFILRSPIGIVCSLDRIPKLKDKINEKQLIF